MGKAGAEKYSVVRELRTGIVKKFSSYRTKPIPFSDSAARQRTACPTRE
jgi:hypothetical protein